MSPAKPMPLASKRVEDSESTVNSAPIGTREERQKETTEISEAKIYRLIDYMKPDIQEGNDSPGIPQKQISIEELYPEWEEHASAAFRNAMQNLRKSLGFINDALSSEKQGESVAADDSVLHFTQLLPKLFCSRSLGDGFGMIINALMIAIQNRLGNPLETSQILAIKHCLEKLRNQPFMSVEEAVSEVILLEGQGLNPDLPELGHVADIPE